MRRQCFKLLQWIAAALVLLLAVLPRDAVTGIIQAIIPAAVPTANKTGIGSKFVTSASLPASQSETCTDANGDLTTVGCGAGSNTGTSVTSTTPVTKNGNTTSDQQLMELSLSAGYFNSSGQPFQITGAGVYSTAALQTPTLEFKAKLCTVSGCGSGTVVTLVDITSTATIAAVTNNNWFISFLAATATTGASGKLEIHGPLVVDLGATTVTPDSVFGDTNTSASSAIDLTAALFLDFTVATSTGNAGNSITQRLGGVMPFSATAAPVTSVAGLTGAVPGQGTDGKVLTAGTVSGTASPLCTDALGGATTSGCPSGTGLFPWNPVASTPPTDSNWTLVNGTGTGTHGDVRNGVLLTSSAANALNGLYVATPGASGSAFTLTAHVDTFCTATASGKSPRYGIWIGDTGNKMVTLSIGSTGGSDSNNADIIYWSNATTPTSTVFAANDSPFTSQFWVRIKYDGTNLIHFISAVGTDDTTFLQLFSAAANANLASNPAKIGFHIYNQDSTVSCNGVLGYWKVTQP